MINDDLISRSAAIEIIRSMTINLGGKDIFAPEAKKSVIGVLDEIDAVDAEPVRHGKWIGIEYDGYADGYPVYYLWECSECGYEHKGEDTPEYCQDCGAKMDVEVK